MKRKYKWLRMLDYPNSPFISITFSRSLQSLSRFAKPYHLTYSKPWLFELITPVPWGLGWQRFNCIPISSMKFPQLFNQSSSTIYACQHAIPASQPPIVRTLGCLINGGGWRLIIWDFFRPPDLIRPPSIKHSRVIIFLVISERVLNLSCCWPPNNFWMRYCFLRNLKRLVNFDVILCLLMTLFYISRLWSTPRTHCALSAKWRHSAYGLS